MAELEYLVGLFSGDFSGLDKELALEYSRQIHEFFRNLVDDSKIDQYIGLAFPEDGGLYQFLFHKLTDKKFNESKEQCLYLIKWIVSRNDKAWQQAVVPFYKRFKVITSLYWRNTSESSKIQNIAIECLIALMEKFSESFDENEFELPSLYWELLTCSEKSSFPPSVRGKIFHSLGLIATLTRNSFMNQDNLEQLVRHILSTIRTQMESKNAHLEVTILLGCIKAMDCILSSFNGRIDTQSSNWESFYAKLKQIIDPKCSIASDGQAKALLKRREFQRAGLELIANNANYFARELYRDYEQWYNDLITWAKSKNSDDNKIGRKAMFKFLESITEHAKAESLGMETDSHENFVNFFLKTFRNILNAKNVNHSELLVAVKGIGWIVTACADSKQIEEVFNKIMEHVNSIVVELNNPVTDKYSGSLSLVSAYLESIGNVLPYVFTSSENDPALNSMFLSHLNSIEQLTVHLITFYPDLNERVRTFSHISFFKIINGLQVKHSPHSVPFLDRVISRALSHVISSPTRAELDILTESWNKTNASSESKKSARSQLGLRGVKAYIQFWINLANHGQDPIIELMYDRVILWIVSTTERLDLSLESYEDQQIEIGSGAGDIFSSVKANVSKDFHLFINLVEFIQVFVPKANWKLFEKWVEVLTYESLSFIKQHPLVSGFYKLLALTMEMSSRLKYFKEDKSERESLFQTCNDFMHSLTGKISEFRDDLLVSVLELWLSAPDEIIIQNFYSLSQTLKMIFGIGRSCLSLAHKSIDALERWIIMDNFMREDIETLIKILFPIWQTYFISSGMDSSYIQDIKRKKSQFKSKKVEILREEKRLKQLREELNDATLENIQLKLLNLIGSFGHILDLGQDHSNDNTLDVEKKFLKYSVPFQDIKPDIYLDSLVPRLLELCENSAERQIKASACEMLHTLILYFLGYHVSSPNQSSELFRRMYRTVMKLGCDSDVLVRQLFNPLAMQSIHWFTQDKSINAEIVLSLIMDGLVQSDDGALRDFSGACLSEYFVWALKHNLKKLAKNLLDQLCILSTHAAPQYRLGASVGFNGLYTQFREDLELKDWYTIALLVSFITSLSLSHDLEEDSLVIKTTKLSILHLERILMKKKDRFNIPIQGRIRPIVIGFSEKIPCLLDLAEWLLIQIGKTEFICRDECLRLLKVLTPSVRGFGSLNLFIKSFVANHGHDLVNIAENSYRLDYSKGKENTTILSFLDIASDFYALLSDNDLLSKKVLISPESKFLESYKRFLTMDWTEADLLVKIKVLRVLNRFDRLKLHFTKDEQQLFIKLSVPMYRQNFDNEPTLKLSESWANIDLTEETKTFLKIEIDLDLYKIIMEKSHSDALKYCQWLVKISDTKFLQRLIDDKEKLQLQDSVWNLINQNLFYLNKAGEEETTTLSKRLIMICLTLLNFWMSLGGSGAKVVQASFDQIVVTDKSILQKVAKGQVFQQVMAESLIECNEMRDFSKLTRQEKAVNIGNLIEIFLSMMKKNRIQRRRFGVEIFQSVANIWLLLSVNCDHFTVARILSGLATINIQGCRDSEELINWWCGPNMITAPHLDLKDKSEFIGFLGLFALSKKTNIVTRVVEATETLVSDSIKCHLKWEDEEAYITKIILQILSVYENIPKNWKLLEILVLCLSKASTMAANKSNLPVFKDVKKRLIRVITRFIKNREIKEQSLMAGCVYTSIEKYKDYQKYLHICKQCLVPILATIEKKAAKTFFKEYFFTALDKVNSIALSIEDWSLKTISFYVIEMLAHKCEPEFIRGDEMKEEFMRKLEKDKVGPSEREKQTVLRALTMACISFKRKGMPSGIDEDIRQAILQCNSASYNAVAASLVSTSSATNVLEGFLIHEDCVKNFLWENIIDPSVEYNFPVILEYTKHENDKLTFSKKIGPKSKRLSQLNPMMSNRINLGESSLATEANHYDFTSSAAFHNEEYYYQAFGQQQDQNDEDRTSEPNLIPDVSIFYSELNKHECMLPFVAAIKKLASILNLEQNHGGNGPKLGWVNYLQKVLKGTHHINIKIFVIGAFLNCPEVMEPYASYFIEPMLLLILHPTESYFGKEKLNYFIKEIIVMSLSWYKSHSPSKELKTRLLAYIIRNVQYEENSTLRSDVYAQNLELIHTLIKLWNYEQVDLPCETIMENFQTSDSLKSGLGVCKKIFQAGLVPSNNSYDLLKTFCRALKNSSKPMYCAAAENIGLLLKYLRETKYGEMEKALEYVKVKLIGEKDRLVPFVNLLVNFINASPKDIIPFQSSIMELISVSAVSSEVLKLLPICLTQKIDSNPNAKNETAADFFADLDGRDVFKNPCSNVQEAEAGLELLRIFLPNLTEEKNLLKILDWIKPIEDFKDEINLKICYANCILEIYLKLLEITNDSNETWSSTEKIFCKIFLRLFKDNDPNVQKICENFWSSSLKKWNESHSLILELIKLIGDEKNALEIIIHLLIKRCSASPDFDKDIFAKELAECRYFNYNLDTSWRLQHASFQPLFAESLSSSQNFSTLPKAIQSTILSQRQSVGKFGVNLLRATLSVFEFSPTQNQGGGETFEPMSMDDNNDFEFLNRQSQSDNISNSDSSQSQTDPLGNLRRKFYHRPDSTFFAQIEVEKQTTRFESTVEKIKAKQSNVNLTRSYRIGDLPDIKIKNSDLLKTLATLASLDAAIGRSVLVLLFTSMVHEVKNRDYKIARDFLQNTKEVFETLLKNHGRSLNPHLAAGVIEISILNNIHLKTSLVITVCSSLDLHELGIMEFEKSLELCDDFPSSGSSKRPRLDLISDSQEVSIWLGIAEFYKELDEYDVLKNVFSIASTKTKTRQKSFEEVMAALTLDASGNVDEAFLMYDKLYKGSHHSEPAFDKFLEDAMMHSLVKLSSWDQLYEAAKKHQEKLNSDDEFFQNDYLGRILPLKILAGLQIYFEAENVEGSEMINEFKSIMLDNNEDESKFLNFNYPLEVAMLMSSESFKNISKSFILLEKAWKIGLKEFPLFSKLPQPQRTQRTLMLQQCAMLNDILHWCRGLDQNNLLVKTNSFLLKTRRLINNKMAPLMNCDIVVAERSHFIRKILDLGAFEVHEDLKTELKRVNFTQSLWILSLGIRDRNLQLSNKYLAKSKVLGEGLTEMDFLEWRKTYIHYLSTFHTHTPLNEWLVMWSSAWKKVSTSSNKLQLQESDAFQMQGELLKCLILCVMGKEQDIESNPRKKVNDALRGKSSLSLEDPPSGTAMSITDLATEESKKLIEKLGESRELLDTKSKACNAYLQMYHLLKMLIDKFPERRYAEDEHLLNLMVECLLRSIDEDKRQGSLLFPSVLSMIEKYESLHESFSKQVKRVPTWIFLPWLDQIVTSYRSTGSIQQILLPLINRLTEEYPQAFQLQYTDLLPRNSTSVFMESYACALKALVLPDILHGNQFLNIAQKISAKGSFTVVLKLFIGLQQSLRQVLSNPNDIYGESNITFAKDILDIIDGPIEKLNEYTSQSMNPPSLSELNGLLQKVFDCRKIYINKWERNKDKVVRLKYLSPWLSKFHHANDREDIELPGLYDELEKPNVALHPRIVSFEPNVTLLQSKTKPLRITMITNTGKQFHFIAKHGDDLRQDRRIQQLFRISNKIFDEDCITHSRKLNLVTYAVAPVSEEFGIVQWVDKTISLKGFILNSVTLKSLFIESATKHTTWIDNKINVKNGHKNNFYPTFVENVGRKEAEIHFNEISTILPSNLLNDNLLQRTENMEKFFRVRQTIIRSYAAMCIVHWLLGIGDRHLENCLLSLETGKFVGIDFGIAFGNGNTALPLPEMVPFRLTPQLSQLMSPYGCKGLFKQTMLHAWRSLLRSSELILSIVDIFVNERSINWLKKRKDQDIPMLGVRREDWRPMKIIKDKMKCKNPINILIEEIGTNVQTTVPRAYIPLIRNGNLEKIMKEIVSDEEVIDLLLDIATDKNILCRIYYGWSAWV